MDETGTYGQFGQAAYDLEEHHWHFQRSTSSPQTLRALGEPKVFGLSNGRDYNRIFPTDGKEGPTRRREKQVKALVKRNPELQPGSGLLTDLARVSEAVEESASRHDSIRGNLLAFGVTMDEFAKRQVGIVAFPTGPTGSDLLVVQVRKQRRGWHSLKNLHLEVPTIHGEQATWTGPGIPIQSIAFANPHEGTDPFLAVRLITQTLIFRPVLRKQVVCNGSRLDLNFLVSIDLDQTGNEPHADVTFNPWYARQLAILDQAGCCTVFELDRNSPAQMHRVKRVASSQSPKGNPSKGESASDDCWGRVIWISSPSTLAVCRRRTLKVFVVAEEHLIERHELDVGLTDVGWILDMAHIPSQPNYMCIATSQHLVVYYVDDVVPRRIAQVRHFRNSGDISLQLNCFSNDDDTLIFLRSSFDPTIMIYRLHLADKSENTIGDPIEFALHTGSGLQPSGLHALHFNMSDLKGDFQKDISEREINNDVQKASFFQCTTLQKDYSVRQALCVASTNAETVSQLGSPTWERDLSKSVHKVLDDDFIVCDEDDDGTSRSEPMSSFVTRMSRPQTREGPEWTVNHQLTERRLNNVDVSDVMSMDEALEAAREALTDGTTDEYLPFRTLKELIELEITLQNVESASSGIQRLLLERAAPQSQNAVEHEGIADQQRMTLRLQSILSLSMLEISATDQSPLNAVYKSISDRWIQKMPDHIAEIVRHSKEQLACRMAAEVSLASLVIRPHIVETKRQTQSQSQSLGDSQSQGQVWELPVRPGAPLSARTTPSVYFDAVSSPRSPRLPTPSETGSSSSAPASNVTLARLSRYATFISQPTPPPLSRRLKRILSHWPVGEDPTAYDWASASRHITRRDEEEAEGEEMTEKERQRQQRRTERFVRRQRREAEETARLQLLSSQAPEIVVGSQPARVARANSQQGTLGADSQSQSQSQGRGVASQVLPGRHGGRKPAKKKRKSGF